MFLTAFTAFIIFMPRSESLPSLFSPSLFFTEWWERWIAILLVCSQKWAIRTENQRANSQPWLLQAVPLTNLIFSFQHRDILLRNLARIQTLQGLQHNCRRNQSYWRWGKIHAPIRTEFTDQSEQGARFMHQSEQRTEFTDQSEQRTEIKDQSEQRTEFTD